MTSGAGRALGLVPFLTLGKDYVRACVRLAAVRQPTFGYTSAELDGVVRVLWIERAGDDRRTTAIGILAAVRPLVSTLVNAEDQRAPALLALAEGT
jgi:hypothetical protein